ncbi:hypothetical protein SAMN03159376_02053 [Pseudomonas sp. NFACC09-4]|uniref:hypothetical protein n=1 Tax=Pseudomonas sp. NFACC09-4 TaxID=1566237 RepID=UPI000908CBFE|nr:hypothetical protein [Pseudomonas sp. NFACC09-4]SFW53748.1 hypothetical protein SAMN03159376_02053 [Pseudomonas sp. NFACC09-4]
MIGEPMPNPRDAIIQDLNQKLDQFFGAGKKVELIASGVSNDCGGPIKSTRSEKLRAARDKDAPRLRALAKAGKTIGEAAKAMDTDLKRAKLIASENGIKFPGQQ